MPTTVTTTLGSSHTDPLIQTWINTLNGQSLVALDQIWEGACYNDSEFVVAGTVANFNTPAYTADATRYPILDCGTGQSFRDNASVRSNALYYNVSNGVGLRNSGTSAPVINMGGGVLRIQNLQIQGDTGSSSTITSAAVPNTQIISNCIIVGTEMELQCDGLVMNNCLFVNTLGPFTRVFEVNTTGTITFNYCTFIAAPSLARYVAFDAAATLNFVNCAFFGGGTTSFSSGSGTANFTTCMTDITGTTGLTGGKTFANQFVSTTNDFRTKAGADLIGAGTPVGGVTTDISGANRPATPTIGAWEFAPAPPAHRITTLGAGFLMPRVGLLPGALAYGAKRLIDNPRLSRRGFIQGWRP